MKPKALKSLEMKEAFNKLLINQILNLDNHIQNKCLKKVSWILERKSLSNCNKCKEILKQGNKNGRKHKTLL